MQKRSDVSSDKNIKNDDTSPRGDICLVLIREVTTETASMATDKQTKWFSLQIISFTPCLKKNQKQTQKKQHFG